jgi:hypothetical protein
MFPLAQVAGYFELDYRIAKDRGPGRCGGCDVAQGGYQTRADFSGDRPHGFCVRARRSQSRAGASESGMRRIHLWWPTRKLHKLQSRSRR